MKHILYTFLVTFVFIQCVLGADSVIEEADDDDDDEGTYQIIEGNCSLALVRDQVFHDHVEAYLIPLIKRNVTSTWYGDEKIYCLEVLNEDDDESTAGTAFVKEGGVGHHFITIEMHSQRSHGMEFDIQVYGK